MGLDLELELKLGFAVDFLNTNFGRPAEDCCDGKTGEGGDSWGAGSPGVGLQDCRIWLRLGEAGD